MADHYFTEREGGERARIERVIAPAAWRAIAALVIGRVNDGALGAAFRDRCCEYPMQTVGVDVRLFGDAMAGEIPSLDWPLPDDAPDVGTVMDLVEFVDRHVAAPEQRSWHDFYRHHHLYFDAAAGQTQWRTDVRRILGRNGIAFDIDDEGRARRIGEPVVARRAALLPLTGDRQLDEAVARALELYFTPAGDLHREALQHLWRGFERLKSTQAKDKKASVAALLDLGADEPMLRAVLEEDAHALTSAGNGFEIRHTEVGKVAIEREDQVDYLFGRLFNLMWLLVPRIAGQRD